MTISFRFQTLLDYRHRIVEDRQIELAETHRQLVAAQDLLAQMLANRARFGAQLQGIICGVLRVDEIEQQYRYLAVLDEQIESQRAVVSLAEEAVESARARLEAALKERKTLEKLKEYGEQGFAAAMRQRESKQIDDLNIVRYSRSGR